MLTIDFAVVLDEHVALRRDLLPVGLIDLADVAVLEWLLRCGERSPEFDHRRRLYGRTTAPTDKPEKFHFGLTFLFFLNFNHNKRDREAAGLLCNRRILPVVCTPTRPKRQLWLRSSPRNLHSNSVETIYEMGTCCSAPEPVVAKEVWDEFYDETMTGAGKYITEPFRGARLCGHAVPKIIGPYASVAYRASPETGWPALEFYAKILRIPAVLLHDGSTLDNDSIQDTMKNGCVARYYDINEGTSDDPEWSTVAEVEDWIKKTEDRQKKPRRGP